MECVGAQLVSRANVCFRYLIDLQRGYERSLKPGELRSQLLLTLRFLLHRSHRRRHFSRRTQMLLITLLHGL